MFKSADSKTPLAINTFLGEGTQFEGVITFKGTIRIDGRVKGEITSPDTLIVGEQAEVRAKIDVGNAVIFGRVIGDIYASGRIEMKKTAQVIGNIHMNSLDIENGALFEGNCEMLKKPSDSSSKNEGDDASTGVPQNVVEFDKAKRAAKGA